MLHSNLSPQRVLIFGSSIFEEGIAHLLTRGANAEVSCSGYTNELAFLVEIVHSCPDVVMLNDNTPLNKSHIFKLLFSIPSLVGLRIIVTRLGNNLIDVYLKPEQAVTHMAFERQQFDVTKQDELVAVVQG
jgi:hypothetical protein